MIKFETINEAGNILAEKIKAANIQFDGEAIVFIGALGICVRKILPLVNDKYTDPAVVCVDTKGKYAIPVLSGHIGGANELARMIANTINAEAIITTQSDNSGLWALDLLAKQHSWNMKELSRKAMNSIIATFINKKPTAVVLEIDDDGTRQMESTCPEHAIIYHSFKEFEYEWADKGRRFELLIIVSPFTHPAESIPCLQFCPKCLHLGVGCQKNTNDEAAHTIISDIEKAGFAKESIDSIGTISLKKNEPLIEKLSKLIPQAEIKIHEAEELAKIEVPNPSEKVYSVTGCYGVAESSALAENNDSVLVVEKQKGEVNSGNEKKHYTWALSQDLCSMPRKGHIEIVGAGPGDPDLVSVRGRKFLQRADLILYAGSLVPKELTFCAKPEAVVRSSAGLDLEEQFQLMKDFYDKGKLVVRLHTGDPCIYGAIQEQMAFFDKYNMDYHITPGISSFLAAAAELKSQFTIPERCQTIILTRGEGRTPMPDKEKLHLLAKHQSTMCIFLSANIVEDVMKELLEGGYPPETPVAACYKLTWKDQRIYRGQLKDLAKILKENNLTLTTMIVVGEAIENSRGLSKLYDGHFTHMFRKARK